VTIDNPRVELRGVMKHYAGTVAVKDISLSFAAGTVHALVGANGAGKSTIGKMIAGAIRPDAGEILVDGKPMAARSPKEALAHGVALISQELALVPDLRVIDNVYLGSEPRRGQALQPKQAQKAFEELIEQSGLHLDPQAKVKDLGVADQQKVEILRAINRDAAVIVMDEPTSSLTGDESERLRAIIRRLAAGGTTIVLVSHFLDEVLALSDTVTVVRNGAVVSTKAASTESESTLVAAMLGHSLNADYVERPVVREDAPTVLEVSDLRRDGKLNNVSLHVRRGEILGLAGLVGSGRTELARAIFGADPVDGGTVSVEGVRLPHRNPRRSINGRIVMLPESRKNDGLLLGQSAAANVTLPYLRSRRQRLSRLGWRLARREHERVRVLLGELAIKPADPRAIVNTMSGGNQQKVLFGKCLFDSPLVLILDEPTRGVDVGARRSIHELIAALAAEGAAVLLISSDLDEVVALAHRVLVLHRGSVMGEFPADSPMDDLMEAAFGLSQPSQPPHQASEVLR
jgi:rhamnose transport system ATP-binding protein